jgi:hypothetical protein
LGHDSLSPFDGVFQLRLLRRLPDVSIRLIALDTSDRARFVPGFFIFIIQRVRRILLGGTISAHNFGARTETGRTISGRDRYVLSEGGLFRQAGGSRTTSWPDFPRPIPTALSTIFNCSIAQIGQPTNVR